MRLIIILSIIFTCFSGFAETIRVGLFGLPPFVIMDKEGPDGFIIDYWQEIASKHKLESDFSYFTSLDKALLKLKHNQIDVLIGTVPVNSTIANEFAYTQPYYRVKLEAAVLDSSISHWHHINDVIGTNFYLFLGLLLIYFIVVSILIWWFEHRDNKDQFFENKKQGIIEGFWFALSTMTTNGYADKTPRTIKGRVLSTIWIITSVLLYSSITASITTFLTMSSINIEKTLPSNFLKNKLVAVQDEDTGKLVYASYQPKIRPFTSLDTAFNDLEKGNIIAIIATKPELSYKTNQLDDNKITVVNTNLGGELYGFLFPTYNHKYYKLINNEIIRSINLNNMDKIANRWGI